MLVGGHRNVLLVSPLKSLLNMFCLSVAQMIPRETFLTYLKQVVSSDDFDGSLCSSDFDKASFCLGEMKGFAGK